MNPEIVPAQPDNSSPLFKREFLIKLTQDLYRLTLLFPKKEPLRYKMREAADDILVNPIENNLEVLASFFEVAKAQNWVNHLDILNLQQEYSRLKGDLNRQPSLILGREEGELKQEQIEERVSAVKGDFEVASPSFLKHVPNNERQQKILEILKGKERTQVWELKKVFPEVTKRTLRRDLDQLLNHGMIKRAGERNETFYTLC